MGFMQTQKLIELVLDYVEEHNKLLVDKQVKKRQMPREQTIQVFQKRDLVDYPRDEEGDICAIIHPDLQGRDFEELHHGEPIFVKMHGGDSILFDAHKYAGEKVYPFF